MIPGEVLAHVPGCEQGRPPRAVQALPGGRGCNEVLRIDTAEGRFVWRRRFEPIDRPGSRARDELHAQRLAGDAGLAPAILAHHPDGHWLLMDYIDAPPWAAASLQTADAAARLAGRLARLHALPVPADFAPVDTVAMADDYLARLAGVDAGHALELAPLRWRVRELAQELAALRLRPVLNHGDLMAGNLLGTTPVLVDWEYAQVADPGWDLACLLTYYPGMARFLPQLLEPCEPGVRAALPLQRERFALLNRLWESLAERGAG